MRITLFFFILLLNSLSSIAGTIDDNKSDEQYLEYGNKHKCVVKLIGHMSDEKHTPYSASGVMISPYYALTAAHVIYGTMTQYIIHDGKPHLCVVAATHSEFKPKDFGHYDIAILRINDPINLDFYPELYKEKDELKKICSIAGYGNTGKISTGYDLQKTDGKKRAGSNIITNIEKHMLICSSTDKVTELEFIICPGDSGGGLFINNKLAGINSCVFASDGKTDGDYGDTSGHTRISQFNDWIIDSQENIEKLFSIIKKEK